MSSPPSIDESRHAHDMAAALREQLKEAEQVLAKRIAHRDRCAAEYRATSDGIAESMRDIELALDRGERRRLLALHAAAEDAAFAEFEQRRARWEHQIGEVTGPLKALRCGPNAALTALLVRHRIMGSYRYQPRRPVRKVTVLRIGDMERIRRSFTVTGDDATCETLADALTILATQYRSRFYQLCGENQVATDILDALNLPAVAAPTRSRCGG